MLFSSLDLKGKGNKTVIDLGKIWNLAKRSYLK